jgi:antitoxin component YwqK of YwqJK toxin-antitoxin module
MQGPCSIYEPNGLKIKDVYYNQGTAYMINEFYPSGEIKYTYDIKNGKANGMYISFHENGKINIKVPYINDKPHGLEKAYSIFGNLISEINFYYGVRHGTCTYYDSNGDILDIYIYNNGFPIKFF